MSPEARGTGCRLQPAIARVEGHQEGCCRCPDCRPSSPCRADAGTPCRGRWPPDGASVNPPTSSEWMRPTWVPGPRRSRRARWKWQSTPLGRRCRSLRLVERHDVRGSEIDGETESLRLLFSDSHLGVDERLAVVEDQRRHTCPLGRCVGLRRAQGQTLRSLSMLTAKCRRAGADHPLVVLPSGCAIEITVARESRTFRS